MAEKASEAAAKAASAKKDPADNGEEKTKRDRRPAIPKGAKIKLLVDGNPKRAESKSRERFAIYRNGMTVEDFVAKGGLMADIRYDIDHKFIELTDIPAPTPEVPAAKTAPASA